jgi:predicted DCC family thiol-disulfide oxidoreductase YuxK
VVRYVVELSSACRRGWDAFFFRPADPTPLGLIRVVVGILLLWSMGTYGLDLHDFFGSNGWGGTELVREKLALDAPRAWSFWFFVPDAWLWPAWTACMLVLALFTLGIWTRVTAVLAWVIVISTVRRAVVSVFGYDQIVTGWVFYLAVTGASGQALSLDRFWTRWRLARRELAHRRADGRWPVPPGAPAPSVSANLALRMIQLHLILIYWGAGFSKLQGIAWWDGTALWGLLASPDFSRIDLTWLVNYPWVLNILTHATVFIEAGYPVLIWVRPLRPLWLAIVFGLHIGIAISAPGLAIFSAAMLAGNLAFCSGPWLRSLASGRNQPSGRVLYDGACPRCRASMALIGAADPDHVVEPIDLTAVNVTTIHRSLTKEACLQAMHLVHADGRVVAGYDAIATLLRWHPLCWLFGIVGSAPGVRTLGRKVYARIAASRPRDAICTDEVCGIHPAGAPKARETTPTAVDSQRTHR